MVQNDKISWEIDQHQTTANTTTGKWSLSLNWLSHTSRQTHYGDLIMSAMVFQITGVSNVCSTVCSGANKRKHQSSASQAFWGECIGDR